MPRDMSKCAAWATARGWHYINADGRNYWLAPNNPRATDEKQPWGTRARGLAEGTEAEKIHALTQAGKTLYFDTKRGKLFVFFIEHLIAKEAAEEAAEEAAKEAAKEHAITAVCCCTIGIICCLCLCYICNPSYGAIRPPPYGAICTAICTAIYFFAIVWHDRTSPTQWLKLRVTKGTALNKIVPFVTFVTFVPVMIWYDTTTLVVLTMAVGLLLSLWKWVEIEVLVSVRLGTSVAVPTNHSSEVWSFEKWNLSPFFCWRVSPDDENRNIVNPDGIVISGINDVRVTKATQISVLGGNGMPLLELKLSDRGGGRGRGVFAGRRLSNGTMLGNYCGPLVAGGEGVYALKHPSKNGISIVPDGNDCCRFSHFVNHSKEAANVEISNSLVLCVIRDIAEGEELLLDYGEEYWRGVSLGPS